jgi:hypothetical protein
MLKVINMEKSDAHALVTLFMEWKACILEHHGELPEEFERIVSSHLLAYVQLASDKAEKKAAELARDVIVLKEIAKC